MYVSRVLTRLKKDYPDLEVERVDVVAQAGRAWQDGIRMIPCLRCGNKSLSGLFLSAGQIRRFVEERSRD